jgi:hypothetical protein
MGLILYTHVPESVPHEKWPTMKLFRNRLEDDLEGRYIGEVVEVVEEGPQRGILRAWVYGLWEREDSPWMPHKLQELQSDGSWAFPEYITDPEGRFEEDFIVRFPLVGRFTIVSFLNGDITKPIWDTELAIRSVERVEE